MYKHFVQIISCAMLLLPMSLVATQEFASDLTELTIHQLEERIKDIDLELSQLAHFTPRSGVGSIGYRSLPCEQAEDHQWIQIELGEEQSIDAIVLVPTIWRNSEKSFKADAFPAAFQIRAGTAQNPSGTVIAEFNQTDPILPRIAPLVIPLSGVSASWVRLETTLLSIRAFDKRYVLQLAEVLIFSGTENVALRAPVETSSNARDHAGAWDKKFLVDGNMPYLMDSAHGIQSQAYISEVGEKPNLVVDLGCEYPISRIHLHTVEQSATVPQAYAGDLGIPHHLLVEGASDAEFTDAVTLLEYRKENINDTGPIMMWRIPEKRCRFVRLAEAETQPLDARDPAKFRIGFAEIEIFSKGVNVALNKPFEGVGITERGSRTLAALTDGNNLYGEILPTRTWLEELARRHDLENLRPRVTEQLALRYSHQKIILSRMRWIMALIAVSILAYILINRNLQMRRITRIKERFAADLHDELGANIHAIGILSDLAKESLDSPQELIELLDRSRVFVARSSAAVRYCTNMLEAQTLCEDLVGEMLRSSERLLADLRHNITVEGETILHQLNPRKRVDLFFFYKECLNNILRHSGATAVTTRLTATPKLITLNVVDNGLGIAISAKGSNGTPPSLKRRAHLLHAKVFVESPPAGGTSVTLKLHVKGRWKIG